MTRNRKAQGISAIIGIVLIMIAGVVLVGFSGVLKKGAETVPDVPELGTRTIYTWGVDGDPEIFCAGIGSYGDALEVDCESNDNYYCDLVDRDGNDIAAAESGEAFFIKSVKVNTYGDPSVYIRARNPLGGLTSLYNPSDIDDELTNWDADGAWTIFEEDFARDTGVSLANFVNVLPEVNCTNLKAKGYVSVEVMPSSEDTLFCHVRLPYRSAIGAPDFIPLLEKPINPKAGTDMPCPYLVWAEYILPGHPGYTNADEPFRVLWNFSAYGMVITRPIKLVYPNGGTFESTPWPSAAQNAINAFSNPITRSGWVMDNCKDSVQNINDVGYCKITIDPDNEHPEADENNNVWESNIPPVAVLTSSNMDEQAGATIVLCEKDVSCMLDGSGSFDPNGAGPNGIASYNWRVLGFTNETGGYESSVQQGVERPICEWQLSPYCSFTPPGVAGGEGGVIPGLLVRGITEYDIVLDVKDKKDGIDSDAVKLRIVDQLNNQPQLAIHDVGVECDKDNCVLKVAITDTDGDACFAYAQIRDEYRTLLMTVEGERTDAGQAWESGVDFEFEIDATDLLGEYEVTYVALEDTSNTYNNEGTASGGLIIISTGDPCEDNGGTCQLDCPSPTNFQMDYDCPGEFDVCCRADACFAAGGWCGVTACEGGTTLEAHKLLCEAKENHGMAVCCVS